MNINYNDPTKIFRSIFALKILVEKYIFTIFVCNFSRSRCKVVNNIRNTLCLGQNTSKYRSQIVIAYVHENGFL